MKAAHVEIKGKNLIVTIEMEDPPKRSESGKSLVIASTRGLATSTTQCQGKPIVIGLNAFISLT